MPRPLRLILPLALLVAVLVAGCGSDDSGETTGGAETTQAQESGAAPVGASTKPCLANDGATAKILRVTGVGCGRGEAVADEWAAEDSCRPSGDDTRGACSVGRFRCFSTVFGKGLAVSCARPGQAVNFVSRNS